MYLDLGGSRRMPVRDSDALGVVASGVVASGVVAAGVVDDHVRRK